MNLIFHQLNVRNIEQEIEHIKKLQLDLNNYILGLEITHDSFKKIIVNNIDPQHIPHQSGHIYTCVEEVFFNQPSFNAIKNKNVYVYLLKTDLDCIAAAALIDLFLKSNTILTEKMTERIFAIANYDRHSREYERININQYSKIKIPRGLFLLVSGWKNTLKEKINAVKSWILTEKFYNIEYFNNLATKNFQESIQNSKVELLKPHNAVFVKSTKRGACGLGYQYAPIVIAMNPSFRFGFGEDRIYGRKWVVAQCNEQFIN